MQSFFLPSITNSFVYKSFYMFFNLKPTLILIYTGLKTQPQANRTSKNKRRNHSADNIFLKKTVIVQGGKAPIKFSIHAE